MQGDPYWTGERDRLPIRRLFHVSARYIPAARRPGRRPRRGPGVQLAAASPRLSHPFRAGGLGGNRRPDQRHKPFAPARALGSRCLANPFHDVWRTELLPSLRALAGHAAEAGLHYLRSVPTLSLPFYLVYICAVVRSRRCRSVSRRIYFLLLWISIFNMALAFVMFNRSIGLFGLGASLIFPFYQGVYLKCARFFSYSSEIIFATSRHDDFVPPRVRRALFGRSDLRSRLMDVMINRLDPNVPDPVESRRRAAGRLVRIAYATIVFGVLGFFVVYFGCASCLSQRARHRLIPATCGFASLYRAGQPDEPGAWRHGQGRRRDRTGAFTASRTASSQLICGRWRTSPAAGPNCASRPGSRRNSLEASRSYLRVTEEAAERIDAIGHGQL